MKRPAHETAIICSASIYTPTMSATQPLAKPAVVLFGFACVFVLGAGYVQMTSELPLEYSWSKTLTLFWNAITDKYFIVMSFIALAAARQAQRKTFQDASRAWRHTDRYFPIALTVVVLCILVASSEQYGVWDYLFLLPVAALSVQALQQRALGKASVGLIATVLVLILVSYVFTIFKSQLFVHSVPLDRLIVGAETLLFGRPLYLIIAEWSSSHPLLVSFSDWVYFLFFHHMALTALFLFAYGDTTEQWRYILSLSLCYLLGSLLYYILPGLGPAYFDPGHFAYLAEHAEFTRYIQKLLQESTDRAIHGNLGVIETYAFIACMPSLHMAHETVMLFYSRRSPIMLLFAACFWVSACIAVLVLGWHYLFDVFGGILLALLVVAIAQRVRFTQRLVETTGP